MYMDLPTTEAELDSEPLEVIENEPLHIPWPRFLPQRIPQLQPPVVPESTVDTRNQLLKSQSEVSPQADGSLGNLGKFDQHGPGDTQQSRSHGSATDDPGRVRMVRIPVVDVNKNADHTRGKKTKGMKFIGFEGPSRRKQEKQEMRNRQAAALAALAMSSNSEISASHPPFNFQLQ